MYLAGQRRFERRLAGLEAAVLPLDDWPIMARRGGFEPPSRDSKSRVLPLNERRLELARLG